ncbi:MAG: hypothetical protein U0Q16_34350 [Bryobacteraceae bacterium]
MRRTVLTSLLVAALLDTTGCLFRKRKPDPPQVVAPPALRTQTPETPNVPPPPAVETAKSTPPLPPTAENVKLPPKPVPKPQKKVVRKPRPAKPAQPPPLVAQQPTPTTEAAAPPPQLTQIMSPADQAAYNRAIDVGIATARANLAKLANRTLSDVQDATLKRVTGFIRQAEETRLSDLPTAKSYAERASLLSEDLVKTIQ